MSDLIDRQAAIDAVKMGALSAATIYGRTDEGSAALYETVRAIKALPSAQLGIIRCKDCKYADDDGVCQNSVGLVIQDDDDFCSKAERRQDAIN